MRAENLRNLVGFAKQSVIIRRNRVPQVQPGSIVMPQQLRVPLGKRAVILHLRKQRQPPRQKITAQRHIGLPIVLNPGARAFEFDMCIR